MNRNEAISVIKEIFAEDTIGIRDTFTDEQLEAIKLALAALENPECMSCGYCRKFVDEDVEGQGWCEQHDREVLCTDYPCSHYE